MKGNTPQGKYSALTLILWLVLTFITLLSTGCSNGTPPKLSKELAVQGIYNGTISPDKKFALIGSINHGGSLWTYETGERVYNWNHQQGQFTTINNTAFSENNLYAITASPQTLVLWDTATGKGLSYWTAPSEILDVKLISNGDIALLGLVDHSATLFDVKNGGVIQSFYHDAKVQSVDSKNNFILSGSEDRTAKLWDIVSGKQIFAWNHKDEVHLVKLSDNAKLAFTMAKYDKAVIWDTKEGIEIARIPLTASAIKRGQIITAVSFSTDNKYLLTGDSQQNVKLWQIEGMKKIKHWKMPKREALAPTSPTVLTVEFGEIDEYFAITSDGFIHQMN